MNGVSSVSSPQSIVSLACGYGCNCQLIVVGSGNLSTLNTVKGLRIWIAKVVHSGGWGGGGWLVVLVVVGGWKWGWEIRWLEVLMMGSHAAAAATSGSTVRRRRVSMMVVMVMRTKRWWATACATWSNRRYTSMAGQTILKKNNICCRTLIQEICWEGCTE